MGRYVPPEHEGTTSANKLAGKYGQTPQVSYSLLTQNRHALGNRARKAGQGILTVRFEMPFAIWCTTCPKPTVIGQGVRFNAEKKKVGNYHSTPIYSFRMKHNVCGGWMEIRTDPKNTAYVVTEGAKKRDTGEDKHMEGDIKIMTAEERERLQNDAFAALEGKVEDRKQALTDKSRIEELHRAKEKDWDDPYAASKKLRRAFRADRKQKEKNEALTENLKDRMSLDLDLLEETEEDRRRAKLVSFGDFDGGTAIFRAASKPLFGGTNSSSTPPTIRTLTKQEKKTTLALEALRLSNREKLRHELEFNTRAVFDPFLSADKAISPLASLVKRKGESRQEAERNLPVSIDDREKPPAALIPLVDYDSD